MADTNFWLAVAGLGYTAGTLVLGRMIGIGRKVEKLESIEKGFGEFNNKVESMRTCIVGCQKEEGASRATLKSKAETLDEQVAKIERKADEHERNRDLHTDREWRSSTTDRLEAIANSIGKRIGLLETNLSNQIDSIRSRSDPYTGQERRHL